MWLVVDEFMSKAPVWIVLASVLLLSYFVTLALIGTPILAILGGFLSKSLLDITIGDLLLLYIIVRALGWRPEGDN